MKAKTAAAKRKSRKGRPALVGIERQPNGQPSRKKSALRSREAMTETEARSVAVEKRIRDGNIVPFKGKDGKLVTAEEQAIDPRRGYTLGLMWIDGTIQEHQHEAGIRYARDAAWYLGSQGIPFPSAHAQNLFAVRSHSGDYDETQHERSKNAVLHFGKLRKALQAVGDIDTGRMVERKVAEVCVQDIIEARKWPEPTMLLLRKGLNALSYFYGLVDAQK